MKKLIVLLAMVVIIFGLVGIGDTVTKCNPVVDIEGYFWSKGYNVVYILEDNIVTLIAYPPPMEYSGKIQLYFLPSYKVTIKEISATGR